MNASNTSIMFDDQQMLVITVVDLVTSSLSVLGSWSIIWCSLFKRKACFSEVFPIFQLSLADLMASVLMLSIASLYLSNTHNPLELGSADSTCSVLTAMTKCFYINTFLLTLTYAVEALLRVQDRMYRPSHVNTSRCQVKYAMYAVAWVLPIGISIIIIVISHIQRDDWWIAKHIIPLSCTLCLPIFQYNEVECWMNSYNGPEWQAAYKYLFIVPLMLVMIGNLVLYIFIIRTFRKSMVSRGLLSFHQHKEEISIRNKAILYQLVFAVCWVPCLVLGLISLITPADEFDMSQYYWLYVLQAGTAPLQGFLNSIIYGWKREGFKQALTENSSLISTNTGSYLSLSL